MADRWNVSDEIGWLDDWLLGALGPNSSPEKRLGTCQADLRMVQYDVQTACQKAILGPPGIQTFF